MKIISAILTTFAVILASAASAQDLSGQWEGRSGEARRALIVNASDGGRLTGEFYYLGGSDISPLMIPSISVQDRKVRFSLDFVFGYFDGELSADGNTITGTWRTANDSQPLVFTRVPAKTPLVLDPAKHETQFVRVARDVALEVIDWGGTGPALVLLPGFGNTAHVFDAMAPKLTGSYHVYGITRRGFGRSSAPPFTDANYDAERLADDVVAVMNALKLEHAVLVGHSLGGSELSTVSAMYPERVSALVYLDAAYWYAYYAPENGRSWLIEAADLRRTIDALNEAGGTRAQKRELLDRARQNFLRMEKAFESILEGFADTETPSPTPIRTKLMDLGETILLNTRRHVAIGSPSLIIFASPERCTANCESREVKQAAEDQRNQIAGVEKGLPNARIVRIPNADHYMFRTHEAEVLKEMNAFLGDVLKK